MPALVGFVGYVPGYRYSETRGKEGVGVLGWELGCRLEDNVIVKGHF